MAARMSARGVGTKLVYVSHALRTYILTEDSMNHAMHLAPERSVFLHFRQTLIYGVRIRAYHRHKSQPSARDVLSHVHVWARRVNAGTLRTQVRHCTWYV